MSDQMGGNCNVCGKYSNNLQRQCFDFDVECYCCKGKHFAYVNFCEDCKDIIPTPNSVVIINKDDNHELILVDETKVKRRGI